MGYLKWALILSNVIHLHSPVHLQVLVKIVVPLGPVLELNLFETLAHQRRQLLCLRLEVIRGNSLPPAPLERGGQRRLGRVQQQRVGQLERRLARREGQGALARGLVGHDGEQGLDGLVRLVGRRERAVRPQHRGDGVGRGVKVLRHQQSGRLEEETRAGKGVKEVARFAKQMGHVLLHVLE